MMRISVINHTTMSDEEVQSALSAINQQIADHFRPYWHIAGALRLEGRLGEDPDLRVMSANMRGDAILYLEDAFSANDPLGFHAANYQGIPFGFVYTELSTLLNEPWTVTLSHEALELLADPEVNRLVMGPHPRQPHRDVFHWYEVCDAVQSQQYLIDGVAMSNFVLPLYCPGGNEIGGRNDFLGTTDLTSFGINEGGYVGFFDPQRDDHDSVFADASAQARAEVKSQAGFGRRSVRYGSRRGVAEALRATK